MRPRPAYEGPRMRPDAASYAASLRSKDRRKDRRPSDCAAVIGDLPIYAAVPANVPGEKRLLPSETSRFVRLFPRRAVPRRGAGSARKEEPV
jgi:hypothetical protein